jgi:hypothetical protein
VVVLRRAKPAFQGEDELILNDLCNALGPWLRREIAPLRFAKAGGPARGC